MDLAELAGPKLLPEIDELLHENKLTKKIFPNVLYVDNFGSFATRAAIYLNEKWGGLE